jgi:hypothetical protein
MRSWLRTTLHFLSSVVVLLFLCRTSLSQQIYGQITDAITGQPLSNISVSAAEMGMCFTDSNGRYSLSVSSVISEGVPPFGKGLSPGDLRLYNILGQMLCRIGVNQNVERLIRDKHLPSGVYFLVADPMFIIGIPSMQKIVIIDGNMVNGYLQPPLIMQLATTTARVKDEFITLIIRDEADPDEVGRYFDIERDSLNVNEICEYNEQLVPTKIAKLSDPTDSIAVDLGYWVEVFDVWSVHNDLQSWKILGYDSIAVYIPPTPPEALVDLHRAAVNALQGILPRDGYDGYNSVVRNLNQANDCPVYFVAPDCTYVMDNGGIYFCFINFFVPGMWGIVQDPPIRIDQIIIDEDLEPMLLADRICAHELGHSLGYIHPTSASLYPWSIMIPVETGLNDFIDDQTAALTAIQHNRTNAAYWSITNQ